MKLLLLAALRWQVGASPQLLVCRYSCLQRGHTCCFFCSVLLMCLKECLCLYIQAVPILAVKGWVQSLLFFFSVLPSSFFTKLLLFYSLCALGGSMNELLVCKGFRTSLLQLFSSDGRPRLLEVQLSQPSSVLAVRIPAFPMAPRLMYPVSPFECTGADLPCL